MLNQNYERAEQLLPWSITPRLKNLTVEPHWLDDHRFWFKRELSELQEAYEFVLVDSEAVTQELLFDHERLADVLAQWLNGEVSSKRLPITQLVFINERQCHFVINSGETSQSHLVLDLENYHCAIDMDQRVNISECDLVSAVSPDGECEIIYRGHNLFLRDRSTSGQEKALTVDGNALFGYGNYAEDTVVSVFENQPLPPAVRWSNDGRYLAVQRIDKRPIQDLEMPMVQCVPTDGSLRPQYRPYKVNMPGDERTELGSLCVIDLERGGIASSDRPPVAASTGAFIDSWGVQWGDDGYLYHTEWSNDHQILRLIEFDPVIGHSRVLLEERNEGRHAYLRPGPAYTDPTLFRVLTGSNEFIWYSHVSGWGHLYLHDLATGECKNAITEGDFVVTELYQIDVKKHRVYFAACGREPDRNPYYNHFYRVNFDGSDLTLLTPEVSQHDRIYPTVYAPYVSLDPSVSSMSPDSRVFVDTYSRVDQPPTSVLRSTQDGAVLMTLAKCDDHLLKDTPYTPPETFTAKAADGCTDLWGVLHKPSDFDEGRSYPVVLALYGGPHICVTPTRFCEFKDLSGKVARPLAELGCVVATLDPRGTPYRSKAFIDESFGNLQNGGGIEDQVAAVKQLGDRFAWMDLDRVGITGHSSGGYAAARAMLSHSEFFKVGVSSAGIHDHRLYVAGWVETLQGTLEGNNFKEQASVNLADNLTGKLLLVHGDMDANVHIANTFQLIDKLIRNNRDFDLLVLPNQTHRLGQDTYFIRRLWDYFVEHLLLEAPPKNYKIKSPGDVC